MMLLSFTVCNHRSLRDEVTLDFAKPALKRLRPSAGSTWRDVIYPVAGIFGANASGKSTVLDALHYVVSAIRFSASAWLSRDEMPHAPFLLDKETIEGSSRYVLEFIFDDLRYEYGFEVSAQGVEREWLLDLPNSRRRTLLDREGTCIRSSVIPQIQGVAARELALSRALVLDHPRFSPIARALAEKIDVAPLGDDYRQARIDDIIESLVDGSSSFRDISVILRIADVGIENVGVEETELPPHLAEFFSKVNQLASASLKQGKQKQLSLSEPDTQAVMRSLVFDHAGRDGAQTLSLTQESSGTLAWLALAVSAVGVLRHGGVLVVDEIDASLHSHLVETLVSFFVDPELNLYGAQLLFTSHDTYLLSSQVDQFSLAPEQIWFTEKNRDGATELYSLADFPRRKDANVALRYLSGRYGAVPSPAPSIVRQLIEA